MIATEIVTITAIYKIGVTNFQFVLLCGPNRDKTGTLIDDCLVPYMLMGWIVVTCTE